MVKEKGGESMVKTALFVRLEAKEGKEAEVAAFLKSGLALVQEEPATVAWFGIQLGPSTFGIFDAFPDDAGRRLTCRAASRRRSWPTHPSSSRSPRPSKRSTCSRPSCRSRRTRLMSGAASPEPIAGSGLA
jgi:hypothetical protein